MQRQRISGSGIANERQRNRGMLGRERRYPKLGERESAGVLAKRAADEVRKFPSLRGPEGNASIECALLFPLAKLAASRALISSSPLSARLKSCPDSLLRGCCQRG